MNITIDDDKLHQWARDNGYARIEDFTAWLNEAGERAVARVNKVCPPVLADIAHDTYLAELAAANRGQLEQGRQFAMQNTVLPVQQYAAQNANWLNVAALNVAALDHVGSGGSITRAQVEAAFRALMEKYTVGTEQAPAIAAGRALLDRLGVQRRPDIPESKFAECLKLLEDLPATSDEFVARMKA
jgi:hypothetical protein